MRPVLAVLAALALVAAGGLTASGRAQTGAAPASQTQAPLTFRAGVDLIQVDVSVLDRNGRPVRGLTAADFTVLENGKAQEVVAFTAVSIPDPPASHASWLRDTRPDVRDNDLTDGRLFAIIMDDATMPPDAAIAAGARKAARRVIEQLGPADLAAVIFVIDGRRSVDFTNDRRRLLDAVDGMMPSFAYADQLGGTERFLHFASIRTLGLVAQQLSAVPLRRKAIVYISTGVPVDVEDAATVRLIERGTPPPGEFSDQTALEIDAAKDLLEALNDALSTRPRETIGAAVQDAFVRAQHGNVNIYSVDPAGLGGLQGFLESRVHTGNAVAGPLHTPASAFQTARLHRDFLRTVAESSGGRAILNTNDLERGVAEIFRENSTYYLIGYRSTAAPDDRTMRRVTVRVARDGVTTRTRNAYFNPTAGPRALDTPLTWRLRKAMSGVVPAGGVALSVTAAPFAVPGRREAAVAVVLGVTQPGSTGDIGARVEETVAVLISAFTPNGEPRGSSQQNARVVIRSGLADEIHFDVLSRIDLAPGRYQLRLAADSTLMGKSGSVFYDLDVPDFAREPLALSGLVLTADPGVIAAPAGALSAFLSVVPTTQRSFTTGERAVALVQISQRRTPVPVVVTTRVTGADDVVVSRTAETVPANAFSAAGLADYEAGLPLARLAPGEYLLTIEVRLGQRAVARNLRFRVQ